MFPRHHCCAKNYSICGKKYAIFFPLPFPCQERPRRRCEQCPFIDIIVQFVCHSSHEDSTLPPLPSPISMPLVSFVFDLVTNWLFPKLWITTPWTFKRSFTFQLDSMETFCSDSRPCDSHQGILDKCRTWIGSTTAMLGARSRQPTSKMTLVWVFVVTNVWPPLMLKQLLCWICLCQFLKWNRLGRWFHIGSCCK